MLETKIKQAIRDIPDFPKPGIVFKDITPIFQDPQLCRDIIEELHDLHAHMGATAVVGVESRGFLFGLPMANRLNVPFAPVRKKGKLPYETVSHAYDLEYGSAEIEMHVDAVKPGDKVIVHDDLLATGGTAAATAELVNKCGAEVVAFSFVIELKMLKGLERIERYTPNISNLAAW
ncbi:MAG: adenine phosphoribosyltransferase [Flavobacteriales bacterium]|nr:adenine phosphoribosyltransferase [Flavobacteriales bacterium]